MAQATRSPISTWSASGPTASTTPAPSTPGTNGSAFG